MKTILFFLVFIISLTAAGQSVENGEKLFNTNCKACHSLGQGRLVGPDLSGVTKRRSVQWIHQFIVNSSKLIASGDEQAKAIFAEYNKITMPPHPFSASQLNDLVAFIDAYETEPTVKNPEEKTENPIPDDEDISVEKAAFVPLWIKVFLSGTAVVSILLFVTIIFLVRMLKGI